MIIIYLFRVSDGNYLYYVQIEMYKHFLCNLEVKCDLSKSIIIE